MNASQTAKLNMYNAVVSYCNQNIAIINSLPGLQSSFSSFSGTVLLIIATAQKKVQVITGISVAESKSRNSLARQAATIASKIYAYAEAVGNEDLKEQVNFSVSDLQRLKHSALPAICKNILQAAWENLDALAGYNVTAAMNTNFGAAISAYEALEPDSRNARSQRTWHNSSLGRLFRTADSYLKKQMDKVMADFIDINPEFYNTYLNNRIIIDPATTVTQIKGIVTNGVTNMPLSGATIEVAGNELNVKTDINGRFKVKPLRSDIYSITVSKPGYILKTITEILVKQGQASKLNIELLPVAQ